MKKKILTFLLAVSMMLGSLPIVNAADTQATTDKTTKTEAAATPTPTATPKPSATPKATAAPAATPTPAPVALDPEYKWGFSDVPEDNINGEAVYELAKKGVINGYGDKTFKPDNNVTRAEFVKMLVEFAGWGNIYGDNVSTGFPDVDAAEGKEAHWAAKYIKVVASQKIVNGYEDGSFRPDNQVKYEEAMKMIVCYLGRDGVAQNRVQTNPETKLYPDAYMFVGNNLGLSKLVSCKIGNYINRAMVAQIIYNSTGTERLQMQTAVINTGKSSSKGSGGGGGGGGKTTPKPRPGKNSGVDGSGKISGMIVAVKAPESYDDTVIKIDDNIMTYDKEDGTKLRESQIIIKADNSNIDGYYYLRIDEAENYSKYLGYYVEGKYNYESEHDIYTLFDVSMSETEVMSYSSEDIYRTKTLANIAENTVYFYSDTGKRNYKIPENLAELNIIYNGRIVDMSAIADAASEEEGSAEGGDGATEGGDGAAEGGDGATEGSDGAAEGGNAGEEDAPELPITIYDFIPEDGDVEIVEVENEISLIRINSYDTYVAASSPNATTKKMTDYYRKDESGNKISVDLAEAEGGILYIEDMKKSGDNKKIKITDIAQYDVIRIRRSKCGSLVHIRKEKVSSGKYSIREVVGNRYRLATSSTALTGTDYFATDYFMDYVRSDLGIVADNWATVYFVEIDNNKKIIRMVKSAATMELGYLAGFVESAGIDKKIQFLLHSKITAESKATNKAPTVYEFGGKIKLNGVEYTDAKAVIEELKKTAAVINDGKPDELTKDAEIAQPIRYVLESGTIRELETVEFDAENSFKGTPMRYVSTGSSGKSFMAEDGTTLDIPSSSIFMFVTNNRTKKTDYAYFKCSGISALVKNKMYNVEPYYLPNTTGQGKSKRLFVVYNETLDAEPTYLSDIVMVAGTPKLSEKEDSYEVSICNNNGTTKFIDLYDNGTAFLLDENFVRTGETRTVQKGDIIRYGTHIDGSAKNIEILYDVENDLKNAKGMFVNADNELTTDFKTVHEVNETKESDILYLMKVGMIYDEIIYSDSQGVNVATLVPDENGGYKEYIKRVGFSKDAAAMPMVLYNLSSDENTIVPKTANMSALKKGDIVLFWRGEDNVFKGMYVVRYDSEINDIVSKYQEMKNAATQLLSFAEDMSELVLMEEESAEEIIEEVISEIIDEEMAEETEESFETVTDLPVEEETVMTELEQEVA